MTNKTRYISLGIAVVAILSLYAYWQLQKSFALVKDTHCSEIVFNTGHEISSADTFLTSVFDPNVYRDIRIDNYNSMLKHLQSAQKLIDGFQNAVDGWCAERTFSYTTDSVKRITYYSSTSELAGRPLADVLLREASEWNDKIDLYNRTSDNIQMSKENRDALKLKLPSAWGPAPPNRFEPPGAAKAAVRTP